MLRVTKFLNALYSLLEIEFCFKSQKNAWCFFMSLLSCIFIQGFSMSLGEINLALIGQLVGGIMVENDHE